MNFNNSILIVVSLFIYQLFATGCTSEKEKFVRKFSEYDFNKFARKSFFVRDFEGRNNPIIFVYKDNCNGFQRVIIDSKLDSIKLTDFPGAKTDLDCWNDSLYSNELAIQFVKLDINAMSVDSNLNAYFNVLYNEQFPHLIKFSDKKFITGEYKTKWEQITGNWYKLRDEYE
ncbi:MAG: hypothetical protein H7Y00_06950 [Fimbriimonadaceae bacterium]|nr:hypothetical protein [Chitinophagales bacterium]